MQTNVDKGGHCMSEKSMLSILDNNKTNIIENETVLKCFKSELRMVENLTLDDLFSGFQTIKAITFSYDINFINKIMKYFDYGEIILGGNFLIQKDGKMQELVAEVCTNAYESGKAIKKYNNLVDMMTNGDIEFRTPTFVLDHRKIYLLSSDDGRTRVIKGSANMSGKAWDNSHIEHYEYDDSEFCYREYEKDFETAWELSEEITMEVVSSKKADDLIEGNAILKGVKETGQTIVLQQSEDDIILENVKYAIDHENLKEEYKAILSGTNPRSKKGIFEITPKSIEKINHNIKKINQKKITVSNITERYPSLTIDLYNKDAFLNNEKIDLHPTENEIKQDIEELFGIFNNFEQFVSPDVNQLKNTHFKVMNAIFCSPFNAKFRCTAKLKGIPTSSLPLFTLISSESPNSGKTFMIKAALKMMTGNTLDAVKAVEYSKDKVRATQLGAKGIPFFIDEIDNRYISNIKDIIKNPEKCEDNQIEDMAMILFASNDVIKPEGYLRKRMVFFAIKADLPSGIDKTAYESRGKAIVKKLGTGFYREYLRRMIDRTKEELDYMIHSKSIPDEYYVDIMAISSDIFLSIIEDYGYAIPEYMTRLTWENDYSPDSNAEDVISEIGAFYQSNKKSCTVTKDKFIIELGTDKNSQKIINSWKNMLPAEMKVSVQTTRDYSKITIDKKELELRLGYKLGGISWFRRK